MTKTEAFMWGMFIGAMLAFIVFALTVSYLLGDLWPAS